MRLRLPLNGITILAATLMLGLSGSTQARPSDASSVVAADNATWRLVEQLTADRAMALARERKLADERDAKRLSELADRDAKLRAAEQQANLSAQALQKIRRDRDALTKNRQELTEQLLQRDRQLAAEVSAYREAVSGIANDSAEKRAALQRYADGDRVGAFAVLEDIANAENRARDQAAKVANAANKRKLGPLLLDMKDRGEKTTSDVIQLYEEVTKLDPGLTWDWITLTDLYKEAGKLGMAQQSARLSAAIAEQLAKANPTSAEAQWDLSLSYDRLGEVAKQAGLLSEAKRRYEQRAAICEQLAKDNPWSAQSQRGLGASYARLGEVALDTGQLSEAKRQFEKFLAIAERFAKANPASAQAPWGLAVSYARLGDVAVQAGQLSEAKRRYEQFLSIAELLTKANPASVEATRTLAISYDRLGEVAEQAGQLNEARRRYEQLLPIAELLTKINPASAEAKTGLSSSYTRMGDVAIKAGQLDEAKRRYEQGLAIAEQLAKANPTSAEAQRNLSVSYTKLGNVAVQAGQLDEAKRRYEQGLAIAEQLAKANPTSAEAQREVAVSHYKLGEVTKADAHWQAAARILQTLKSQGRLAPTDEAWLTEVSRQAVGQR